MPRVIIVSAPWGTWIFLKPQVKNPCVSSVHMFLYSEYEVVCLFHHARILSKARVWHQWNQPHVECSRGE